ncbi:MAG: hypothetical protein ACXACX_18930 [Candidatus Hodarchaeales archaeon]
MQILNENIVLGIFFFILFLLFGLMTYLVLKKGTSEINLIFSISTISFMFGSLLCSIDFFVIADVIGPPPLADILPVLGTLFYLWAPIGIFLSAKFILHGIDSYKEPVPIILVIFLLGVSGLFLFTSGGLVILEGTSPGRGTWYGTIVISIILIADLRDQLSFLIGGIILGIASLTSVLISTGDLNILPMEFSPVFLVLINVGILISAFAFTNIPHSVFSQVKSTST